MYLFSHVFHPDLLTKLPSPEGPVESGDVVFIKEDEREVKRLQKGHGGWAPPMARVRREGQKEKEREREKLVETTVYCAKQST